MITKIVFRTFLFFVLLYLSKLMIINGLANYYADERNHRASEKALNQSITLNPGHSYALAKLATHSLKKGQYGKAKALAFQALANNPTYGLPTSLIIEISSQLNNEQLASEAVNFTQRLWPAHAVAHEKIANYWGRKGRIDKLLPEWNILLSQDSTYNLNVFSAMFPLTLSSTTLKLFFPYTNPPPKWWESFFSYLSQQTGNLGSLEQLYIMRLSSKDHPLSENERSSYINRLIRDKQWMPAYFTWLSGLKLNYQEYFNFNLHNGDFESHRHNTGFDWHYKPNRIVDISHDDTQGMHGKAALRVIFKSKKRINFQHVYQRLLLSTGDYSIRMHTRLDHIKTKGGLKWRMHCLGDTKEILGEGPLLRGSSDWRIDKFEFTVPSGENCHAQLLRLETSSPYAHKQLFSGTIWFDNIMIQSIIPQSKKNYKNQENRENKQGSLNEN